MIDAENTSVENSGAAPVSDSPGPALPRQSTPAVSSTGLAVSSLPHESSWSGLSIRASLALIVIITVCAMSLIGLGADVYRGEPAEIGEPIRSLALIALGYFFSKTPQYSKSPPTA